MTEYPYRPIHDESDDFSLVAFFNVLLRNLRTIVLVPAALVLMVIALSLVSGGGYTAQSRFTPQKSEARPSQFAGLAAQFGIVLGGGSGAESPDFYAALVHSPELLRQLVITRYAYQTEDGKAAEADLVEYFGVEGASQEERVRNAVEVAGQVVSVGTDQKTGILTLRTSAGHGEVAVQMNRRLLNLLSAFNLETRQSQARAERQFVEARMQEAQRELESAEADLERFVNENRRYDSSPQLTIEAGRLQRRVDLRQQVYTSLAQAYEQARIEEVRNTPVITVVDPPEGWAERVGSGVVTRVILALLVGLVIAIGWAFGREYMARQRERNPAEYAEFVARRRETLRRVLPAAVVSRLPWLGNGASAPGEPARGRGPVHHGG